MLYSVAGVTHNRKDSIDLHVVAIVFNLPIVGQNQFLKLSSHNPSRNNYVPNRYITFAGLPEDRVLVSVQRGKRVLLERFTVQSVCRYGIEPKLGRLNVAKARCEKTATKNGEDSQECRHL